MHKLIERIRTRLLASITVGLIALLALSGTVEALIETNFTYANKQTGYYSIDQAALTPDNDSADYAHALGDDQGLIDVNNHCYFTGVNLPHGARITGLLVAFSSPATPNSDAGFALLRTSLVDGTQVTLNPQPTTIANDTNVRTLANLPIVGGSSPVSNIGYTYAFATCLGAGGSFKGARIAYTYTSAGD